LPQAAGYKRIAGDDGERRHRMTGMAYRDLMTIETGSSASTRLVGREAEMQAIDAVLAGLSQHGTALLVRGEAGIGKSALIEYAKHRAGAQGAVILGAVGVESESHLAFAGLHQMLQPMLRSEDLLSSPQREALDAAFGFSAKTEPDRFRVALAAFRLICDAADAAPVVLFADDAHLIDKSSLEVFAFIARRLDSEPVAMLAAIRDEFAAPSLEEARLPVIRLEPLAGLAATTVLDECAPELAPAVRVRVLEEAAGNPLALVELASAVADERAPPYVARVNERLPLTARLQRTFAGRLESLEQPTRLALLAVALDDRAPLDEALAAASELHSGQVTRQAFDPAVTARLMSIRGEHVDFRHPLMRSAVLQVATPAQVHDMHGAFQKVVQDPERQLWHQAAFTIGHDDELAGRLDDYAELARRRGATATATASLERAAALSSDARKTGERLVRAAALDYELGLDDAVRELLRQAAALPLGTLDEARMSWLRQMVDGNVWSSTGATRVFVSIAERQLHGGDADGALSSLVPLALRCWWTHTRSQTREYLVAAATQMPFPEEDPRKLAVLALANPEICGAAVQRHLARVRLEDVGDPVASMQLGLAGTAIGDFVCAGRNLAPAVEQLRAQGRLGLLAQALLYQAWASTYTGEWRAAAAAAAESTALARETRQPQYGLTARLVSALLAALRGVDDDLESLLASPERLLIETKGGPMLAPAHLARGTAALGEGRNEEAFERLWPIFDHKDPTSHPYLSWWAVLELAEAGVRGDHRTDVAAVVSELEPIALRCGSPMLQAGLACARPLLVEDAQADAQHHAALAQDLTRWPFLRARAHLNYGEWLRRQRRVAESRWPLPTAAELFSALGATRWSERARQELRATGETVTRRGPDARDQLTPQELQIAELAATGLSNREIGARLFLSHRTISSHLYRIFPKLEIASRAQLAHALANSAGH
jgi:DNA-binding CsgD family transcriptional regulator